MRVLAAIAIAYTTAMTTPATAQPALEWAVGRIKLAGWEIDSWTEQEVYLVKLPPPGAARIWLRIEYRQPVKVAGYDYAYSSSVALIEADCAQLRHRNLHFAVYRENNMSGDPILNEGPQPWSFAPPSSIAEYMIKKACARR